MRALVQGSLWIAVLALAGCSTPPGGPILRQVGVHAGKAGAADQDIACVPLPVLLGSRVDARKSVDGKFEISIEATRDGADVRFENGGSEIAPGVSILADELRAGYSMEISVRPLGADVYTVRLSSDCG